MNILTASVSMASSGICSVSKAFSFSSLWRLSKIGVLIDSVGGWVSEDKVLSVVSVSIGVVGGSWRMDALMKDKLCQLVSL